MTTGYDMALRDMERLKEKGSGIFLIFVKKDGTVEERHLVLSEAKGEDLSVTATALFSVIKLAFHEMRSKETAT